MNVEPAKMQRLNIAELSTTRLAWREFGDPSGHPLLFFHGWPGSSAQCWLLDRAARAHGFRGFALERPGIGGSPLIAGRRLLDWPPLVEEFASGVGIEKYAVLGISGGGPYALACAAAPMPRLVAVSVACGAPPIAELAKASGLHPAYRFLLGLFRRRPELVKRLFLKARPMMLWSAALQFLPPLRILLPAPDAMAIEDPDHFAGVFLHQRDAFEDVEGLFADAALYAEPWGFELEKIERPVQFWHGRDDANFHYSLAEEMARRLPNASLRIVDHEGHYSLAINQADTILAALRKCC